MASRERHMEHTKRLPNFTYCVLSPGPPGYPQARSSPACFSLLPVPVGLQDVLEHTHGREQLLVTASLGLCLPKQRQEEAQCYLPSPSRRVAAFFCWPGFFGEAGTFG